MRNDGIVDTKKKKLPKIKASYDLNKTFSPYSLLLFSPVACVCVCAWQCEWNEQKKTQSLKITFQQLHFVERGVQNSSNFQGKGFSS